MTRDRRRQLARVRNRTVTRARRHILKVPTPRGDVTVVAPEWWVHRLEYDRQTQMDLDVAALRFAGYHL